jgi:hypothetical protein
VGELRTEVGVVLAGTLEGLVAVGAAVDLGATRVVLDGTVAVVGATLTGTAVAGGSPGGRVEVADAAT